MFKDVIQCKDNIRIFSMESSHMIIVGYVGCGFLFASFIPQTINVLRTNDITNISPLFIGFIILSSFCLGLYAYDVKTYPILLANISVFINNIILLWVYIHKKICRYNTINEVDHGVLV